MTTGAREVRYLGHCQNAASVLPDGVAAIKEFPRPTNLRTLRRFIGMEGFYARFVPNFSKLAAPLNALKRKGQNFYGHRSTNQVSNP